MRISGQLEVRATFELTFARPRMIIRRVSDCHCNVSRTSRWLRKSVVGQSRRFAMAAALSVNWGDLGHAGSKRAIITRSNHPATSSMMQLELC
jgi:hypothetical protein